MTTPDRVRRDSVSPRTHLLQVSCFRHICEFDVSLSRGSHDKLLRPRNRWPSQTYFFPQNRTLVLLKQVVFPTARNLRCCFGPSAPPAGDKSGLSSESHPDSVPKAGRRFSDRSYENLYRRSARCARSRPLALHFVPKPKSSSSSRRRAEEMFHFFCVISACLVVRST